MKTIIDPKAKGRSISRMKKIYREHYKTKHNYLYDFASDLLTDLLHYMDYDNSGMDIQQILSNALMHYDAETKGE